MKKRVLIADDNSANIYMLETLLKGYGFEVTSAENGREALDKARLNPPDLIVTDILMPVMDGYALCREWKADDTLRHIPLVFYTATYTGSKNEDFALNLGADRFIVKPQEPGILMNILKEVLAENYAVRQVAAKPLEGEMEVFRQYNEILFKKLEKKMSDLEIANQKLRISEECYRSSFRNASDVIYTMDKDLNIISMSPSVERILGYKPQDFIGRSVTDMGHIFTPESFEQAVADISLILKGETITATVYRFIAKDGSIKYGEVSGSPLMREGKIVGIVSVARDITDRKQAEEALQESEAKHRALFEYAGDAIFLMSGETFVDCNFRTLEMFRCTREQIIGQPPYRFSPPLQPDGRDSKEKSLEKIGAAFSGESQFFEWKHCRYDGTLFDAEVSLNSVESEGKVLIQASVRDITERKHQEEELRWMNAFLDSIVENIPDMIFLKDAGELRFVRFNRAGETLLGRSREDMLGKNDYDFFSKEQADFFIEKDRNVLQGKDVVDVPEEPIQTKNKGERILHTKKVPILSAKGEPEYLLGISEDITDRKQAEDALRKSEAKYRSILENMHDAYYELDLEGNLIFFNEALISKSGYSREELMGVNYRQYISPETCKPVSRVFSEIYRTGQPAKFFDYEIIMKGGQIKNLESWADLLFDDNNQPTGFRGMARNITDRKKAEESLKATLDRLRKAFGTTIQVMVSAIEVRDPYTAGHQKRSTDLARAITMEMGLSQDTIEAIRMAGPIHDIGKLSIPAEILSKPTRLTEIEFSLIKEHARTGYEMLKDVESPWPLAQIVYQHHERMDGSGYPRNLQGDEILMEARIMAVADVVEAMASHRPYRPGLGIDAALEEIEKKRGTFYDDAVVDACLRLFREKGYQFQ